MTEIFDFLFTNERLRWKVYGLSIGIAMSYVAVNLWVLHRTEGRVFSEIIWVLLASIVILGLLSVVWRRLTISKVPVGQASTLGMHKVNRAFVIVGLLSAIFLTNMMNIDVRGYQAVVANAALDYMATKFSSVHAAALSANQVQANSRRLQLIAQNSVRDKIPVNPAGLVKAEQSLSGYLRRQTQLPAQTTQAAYSATIDLQTAAFKRRVEEGDIKPREISQQGYPINSVLTLSRSVSFSGNHSLFILGDDVVAKDGAHVVFSGIDFLLRGGRLFVEPGSSILVTDAIFRDGDQYLDDVTWANVEFRNTLLLYHGGPIRLRNVTFTDCRFGFPPIGLPSDLVDAVTNNLKQPVNYVYEPAVGK
ncbi:MAG TPA: hypothetical protein VLY23_16255 [Candidatus Acidoferrum sp.]|nr:hypothetical protein [Candidatus Acidoferrum sp.]